MLVPAWHPVPSASGRGRRDSGCLRECSFTHPGSSHRGLMPEIIQCPQCDRKLKVPEDLLGKNVKCPTCGATFTAAAAGGAPAAPPPPVEEEAPRPSSRRA